MLVQRLQLGREDGVVSLAEREPEIASARTRAIDLSMDVGQCSHIDENVGTAGGISAWV